MSDIVTGTPAVVGFTNGGNDGYQHNHGITDKDQQFAVDIENNQRTRDTLGVISGVGVAVEKTGAAGVLATSVASTANQLATEKTGAATVLAIEKIGAAQILESAKNAAATQLQAALNNSKLELQAALNVAQIQNQATVNASAIALTAALNQATLAAQIAACCCEQKALTLEVESRSVRDHMQLLQTQVLILNGGINPARQLT